LLIQVYFSRAIRLHVIGFSMLSLLDLISPLRQGRTTPINCHNKINISIEQIYKGGQVLVSFRLYFIIDICSLYISSMHYYLSL
jgi:hypothetical protein